MGRSSRNIWKQGIFQPCLICGEYILFFFWSPILYWHPVASQPGAAPVPGAWWYCPYIVEATSKDWKAHRSRLAPSTDFSGSLTAIPAIPLGIPWTFPGYSMKQQSVKSIYCYTFVGKSEDESRWLNPKDKYVNNGLVKGACWTRATLRQHEPRQLDHPPKQTRFLTC